MKAVIVNPYFKTLGGGERYALTFAQALLDKGWQVDLTIAGAEIINDARKRFSLPLIGVKNIDLQPFVDGNLFSKWQTHRQYDLIFWFFDGAMPLMLGKNNVLHIQVPFTKSSEKPLLGLLKKQFINLVVCNSIFTQKITKNVFGLNSVVWYPPIGTDSFTPAKKEKLILSVGRFEESMTEKRQDVMVDCFKKIVDSGLKGWQFVLAGGVPPDKHNLLDKLIRQAEGYPVTFEVNVSFDKLVKLYSKSTIFWHTAGYGYDETTNPEKMEHFGMTTCCKPGTIIETNYGVKEIQDINIEDAVRTHNDIWKPVVEVKSRMVHERLYKIYGTELTKEHPVLVIRPKYKQKRTIAKNISEYIPEWVKVSELKIGDWVLYRKNTNNVVQEWFDLGDILPKRKHLQISKTDIWYTVGHTEKTRHTIHRIIKLNREFGRLMGYYLAEGSIMGGRKRNHGISFAFNISETEYQKDVAILISKIFGENNISIRERKNINSAEIMCGSKILGELFHEWCGSGAKHKEIPKFVETTDKDFIVGLIDGYLRGDGCFHDGKSISASTASRILAFQIKRILTILNIISSVSTHTRQSKFKNYSKTTVTYTIKIHGKAAQTLLLLLGKDSTQNNHRTTYNRDIEDEKYIYKKINKIETIEYKGKVYNLEVADDESYITQDFIVHNCEAMASGCVPVVIGKGGQKEIIEDGKNGFLCDGKEEMVSRTKRLIKDTKLANGMSAQAILRAGVFSTDNFRKQVYRYLEKLSLRGA